MRIRDSGFGFLGFGGGGSRSDAFKKGRRPGQKVRGKLLKWISDDMAWVEIDGHKLLAQLQSKPPVGSHLTFIINQLHPKILLKEVFGVSRGETETLSFARNFESARTLFENQFRPHISTFKDKDPAHWKQHFLFLLKSNNKLLSTYLDTARSLQAFSESRQASKQEYPFYAPWLIPPSRRQLGILRPQAAHSTLTESIVEFDLEKLGMVRAEFLFQNPQISYRLKLQHPSKIKTLQQHLLNMLGEQAQCLGVGPLPQREHGGILAELMVTSSGLR